MNFYFLVEGNDEAFIYPQWLAYLRPELQPVKQFDEAIHNHYYLFNAKGYPRILKEALPAAIADVNSVGNYEYLVVCFDADEDTIAEREQEVAEVLQMGQRQLQPATQLMPIIQNRCIETWLLGNLAIYPATAKAKELQDCLTYYHAAYADPELMGAHDFATHAQFHKRYLWLLFAEQRLRNKQQQLREAANPTYLSELQTRITDTPTHLPTFQTFINFCQAVS